MPTRAHGDSPGPQTKRDKSRVDDYEAQGEIVADEAAHKTSRSEDLVQPGDVLLDGVCPLSENQEQENELASAFHKASLGHDSAGVAGEQHRRGR